MHLHCENGCQKVVFVDDPLVCIKCGGKAINVPNCECLMDKSQLGKYSRHPDNHYGQGSKEFWEAEYELWRVTREEYHRIKKEQSPKCPYCGTPQGYAWGTGDCGCGE